MTADAVMAPESAEAARKAITVAISMAENAADLAHDLAAQAWFICVAGGLLGWAATVAISDLAHIEECRSLVAASAWIYMLAMVAAGVGVTVVYIAFRGAAIARRMLRRTCHLEKLYHSNDVCRDYNVFHRVRARMIRSKILLR